jgi:hypothetical protein
MAERKDRMALLSRYAKLHTFHYEEKPLINLNVEQWAADGLLESYGMAYLYDLLQYYFDVAQNPTWKYFAYNTDDIINARNQVEVDRLERAERRKLAKAWLNE